MKKKIISVLLLVNMCICLLPLHYAHATNQVDLILEYANSQVGKNNYPGLCQSFVRACYEYAGIYASTGAGTAMEAYNMWCVSNSRDNIPVGACMYFTGDSAAGHVGIYAGNNTIIDSRNATKGVVKETIPQWLWNNYLGWGWQAGIEPTGGTTEPPTGAWITANKSVISIGEDISFNYNATNATGFTLGIDKAGVGRVRTVSMESNDWYTTSFSESGVYTIYAQCYNSVGSIDSYSVTFKVKADLGEAFYASLSTKGCGKPITYEADSSVKIEAENGTSNQIWKFTRQVDGDYIIASAVDNKLLEMSAGNTENGTLVTVGAEDWGGYYQRWYLYEHADGYYVIHSKHFTDLNRVLDLRDNNYSDGTSIQTYEMNLTDAQLFNIYRWDDIQLKSPELNVTVNDNTATFNWSEVYGESGYHVKIWKDSQYWDGDAYHIEWNAKKPYTIELPDGYYEAYVDAANYFETKMSNVVKFNIKGTPQQITPAPVSTPIPRFTVIMYTDSVEITNNSESEYIPAIIVAKYNNNVLQGLSSTNIPFTAGEKRTIMTGSGQFKVFVWDSLKGMRPLTK